MNTSFTSLRSALITGAALFSLTGCGSDSAAKESNEHSSTMKASSSSQPSTTDKSASPMVNSSPSGQAAMGQKLLLSKGKGSFLIDAPLEKIKGVSEEVQGYLSINPSDLSQSKGEVKIKLSSLKTTTFDDQGKNTTQTEHAQNWLEANKSNYQWAVFQIESVEAEKTKLADIPAENGIKKAKLKVAGTLDLHGVKSKKNVVMNVTFKGNSDTALEVDASSESPMMVSLKEHDIKPRDTLGKFLNGALEQVGKKIDDKVQVSIEISAKKE